MSGRSPSRFLRRSGIALVLVTNELDWDAETIIHVGVGVNNQETDVFKEQWPTVRLIGFEPNKWSYKAVVGDYPGELRNKAISDHRGDGWLNCKKHHKDGSSLRSLQDKQTTRVKVEVSSLDFEFPNGLETDHNLLWLDCEGTELQVLNGASRLIEQVDVINVEMTAHPVGSDWCSHVDVHKKLLELGFKRQWIHTQRISSGQVDGVYVRPDLFRSDYCCCPCQIED